MKKCTIIALLLSIMLLVGCVNLDNYKPIEEYNSLQDKYSNLYGEYTNLLDNNSKNIEKNIDLEEELNLTKEQLEKYQNLIGNLNNLLSNVYYGYAENINYISDGFTAFSMGCKGKYYIITVGHCVENEYGKFGNFKFKSNSDEWIYPELLVYNNDYNNNNDYAVFYSDKIKTGLIPDSENNEPEYILGNIKLNILKQYGTKYIPGESGSPIIDCEGEIIGIVSTGFYYTPIETVIKAIDNLN